MCEGAIVNPDFHTRDTTQGDVTLGIHLDARGVLQSIAGGAGLDGDILAGIVHILLAVHHIERLLGRDFHSLQQRATAKLNFKVINILNDLKFLSIALIAYTADLHQVVASFHVLDNETALHVGGSATHEDSVGGTHEAHVDERQRFAGLGIADTTLHLKILRLDRGHRGKNRQQNKKQLLHNRCCFLLSICFSVYNLHLIRVY